MSSKSTSEITRDKVLDLFHYDSASGELTWKKPQGAAAKSKKAGSAAGSKGHIQVKVGKTRLYLTHLIWLIETGELPPEGYDLDHIDGDVTNNWIGNLRLAKRSWNAVNSGLRKDNTSGFKGVTKLKKGWRARIGYQGKFYYLGQFETAEEAALAYDKAAIKYFGRFSRLNFPLRNESFGAARKAARDPGPEQDLLAAQMTLERHRMMQKLADAHPASIDQMAEEMAMRFEEARKSMK